MFLLFQSEISDDELGTIFLVLIGIGILFYFIPSIIALFRGKQNWLAIIALNFFLGWSVIGWVVSLVWSLSSDSKPQRIVVNQPAPVIKEDNIDKVSRLKKLLDDGAITQEEFDQQKSVVLKNS